MVMRMDTVVVPAVVPVVVTAVEAPVIAPVVVVSWSIPEWAIEVIVRPVVIVDVDVGIAVVPIGAIVVIPIGTIVIVPPITTTKITPVAVVPAAVVVPVGTVPATRSVDVVDRVIVIVVDNVVAIAIPVATADPRWTVGDAWQIVVVADPVIVAVIDSATIATGTVAANRRTIGFCGWATTSTWEVRAVQPTTLPGTISSDVRPIPQSRTRCRFGRADIATADIATADIARKCRGAIQSTQRRSVSARKRSRLGTRLVSAQLITS